MSGRLQGRVAFITGGARGQGRSHAVRLAQEGADIITLDLCEQIETVSYRMSSAEDLGQTVAEVEALDRRIIARPADVRDPEAIRKVVQEGVAELGRLDVVVANAGIADVRPIDQLTPQRWQTMIDINLTGVWNAVYASVPAMREAGNGGSLILISSYAGAHGLPNIAGYCAAKHGVVGIMRSLANELGPEGIRVNTINPGNVGTEMLLNEEVYTIFRPDLEHPSEADATEVMDAMTSLPVPYLEPVDISNAVLFLASDEARYVTGIDMNVDAGWATMPGM